MPQIRPITDLRNTNEISDICHKQGEPLFITKNGYGDLVIMSIETYEKLFEIAQEDLDIKEAEKENDENSLIDGRDALKKLRRKYFG
ncbi:MAG: type II toxin-antitoxin system Phd/YefM family antitoxin [Clostridia bacterium]|nr:type II toxin-antitoxin system Phd/YefM family antitoxin [Clostridia bacterium]